MQFEVVGDDETVVVIPRAAVPVVDAPQVVLKVKIGSFVRTRVFEDLDEDFWKLAGLVYDQLGIERLVKGREE